MRSGFAVLAKSSVVRYTVKPFCPDPSPDVGHPETRSKETAKGTVRREGQRLLSGSRPSKRLKICNPNLLNGQYVILYNFFQLF